MERDGFVLDLVIEDVPPPNEGDAEEIFPKALREAWRAVELPVQVEEDEEPRRAWRALDPESDLEITIVWAKAPADESPEAPEAAAADDEVAPEPPTFDLGISGIPEEGWEPPSGWEAQGESGPAERPAGPDAQPASTPRPGGGLLFGHRPRANARREDLLRVFELGLRLAERIGRRILDPVLGETFEVEDWAYRITEPFRARGFIATHWVRAEGHPGEDWIHTHGMERFGLPDLETFAVPEEGSGGEAVLAYLLELAESWVREDAPAPTAKARRLEGVKVRVVEPAVARRTQSTWTERDLADHDGPRLSVIPAAGDWQLTLDGWRPANVKLRSPGLVDRLCALTGEILPLVRARFAEGADVKLKARFPVKPSADGTSGGTTAAIVNGEAIVEEDSFESMWIHVESWDDARIVGRLANDPERRVDLSCGSAVEVAPTEVWDVLVVQDGQPYRGVSLRRWLRESAA